MNIEKRKSFGALVMVIACLFILSGLSVAAEFSADFVMQEKGKKEFTKGKIFVKGDKIRQEVMEDGKKQITIFRPDKSVIWMVIPEEEMYTLMPYQADDKKIERWSSDRESKAKYLGEETVSGLLCKKYQLTENGEKNYVWISEKFPFPVRMKYKNGIMEYKNIKGDHVPNSLFEIPLSKYPE